MVCKLILCYKAYLRFSRTVKELSSIADSMLQSILAFPLKIWVLEMQVNSMLLKMLMVFLNQRTTDRAKIFLQYQT